MTITSIRVPRRWPIATVCALASLAAAPVSSAVGDTPALVMPGTIAAASGTGAGQGAQTGNTTAKPDATATLEQCLSALVQSERSATFVGEMVAIPGSARMEISIGLLERVPGEGGYRFVSAPGLGGWRGSAAGVKTYTYIKQVTDLAAPAFYRGAVRFRWLNAKGRVIKAEEMRTPRCEQPAVPSTTPSTPATGTTTPSTSTSSTPASD
jgi:hypothetical protein